MKIIGTKVEEVDQYLLDCFSFSHLNGGIIAYYISFWILNLFMNSLPALLITYIVIFLGSIIWELIENMPLVEMKRNHRPDMVVNSQTDTLLVFLGGIIGCYTNYTNWIIKIIIIGSLFLAYTITRILTELKSKKQNSSKMTKKNQLLNS